MAAATRRSAMTCRRNQLLYDQQQRMDYPLYRHLALPIGSSVVESVRKNVVAKRKKPNGMYWTLALVMSRRFRDDFKGLLT